MQYYNIDGKLGGIRIGNMSELGLKNHSFSIEFWFKINSFLDPATFILGDLDQFAVVVYKRSLYLVLGEGKIDSRVELFEGLWTHLALVRDATTETLIVYLNGEAVGSSPVAPFMFRGELTLGHHRIRNEVFPMEDGSIMEFRVWRNALSHSEIAQRRFQRLTGNELQLAYYLPFSEGRGQVAVNHALPSIPDEALAGVELTDVQWRDGSEDTVKPRVKLSLEKETVAFFPGPDREVMARIQQGDLDTVNADFSNGITFEAWIKPRNNSLDNSQSATLFYLGSRDNGRGIRLRVYNDGSVLHYYLDPETFEEQMAGGDAEQLVMDAWNHLGFSIDPGGDILLFINGRLISRVRWNLRIDLFRIAEWMIGGERTNRDTSFAGELAEVRIWQKALSRELESRAHISNRLSGDEPQLLTYLPLNDDLSFIPYRGGIGAGFSQIHYVQLPTSSWEVNEQGLNLVAQHQRSVASFYFSRVVLPESRRLQVKGAITLEAWVQPDFSYPEGLEERVEREEEPAQILFPIISRFTDSRREAPKGWEIGIDALRGQVYFLLGLESGVSRLAGGEETRLENGVWYHLAGTYDGRLQRLFINGIQVAEVDVKGSINLATPQVHIGCRSGDQQTCFQGNMAEVRIWNTRRTREEICRSMHESITYSQPNLLAGVRFTEEDYSELIIEELEQEKPNFPNPAVKLTEEMFYHSIDYIRTREEQDGPYARGYGLMVDYTALPVERYEYEDTAVEVLQNLAEEYREVFIELIRGINHFPPGIINFDEDGLIDVIVRAGIRLQELETSEEGTVEQKIENLQRQRDDLEARLNEVQETYDSLVNSYEADRENWLNQIKGLETFKTEGYVPVEKFIANIHNSVKETQQTLAKTQANYQLQNVGLDLKVLMVEDGMGIRFPKNFEDVNAASLSTMRLTFSPNESLQQVDPPRLKVPDLTGLTEVIARRKLNELGLVIDVRSQIIAKATSGIQKNMQGRIVNQVPKAGVLLTAGRKVEVFVGKNDEAG